MIGSPRESMSRCLGVCVDSCSVGSPRKRWNDTAKDCLRKRFGSQASKENGGSF